jgi:hypothetical protein
MNRISNYAKGIADAHILARIDDSFTNPQVSSKEELLMKLDEGETFSDLMRQIEIRFCSVGSCLMSGIMNHVSQSYKASVYKGFKILLDKEV